MTKIYVKLEFYASFGVKFLDYHLLDDAIKYFSLDQKQINEILEGRTIVVWKNGIEYFIYKG